MKTEKMISEYGIKPEEAVLYEAERGFLLKVCDGPLVQVEKGQKIYLSQKLGQEAFWSNKVVPVDLPETYECIHPLEVVGEDGEWIRVEVGDIIRLQRHEAIRFLREQKVRPKGGNFK